jgi:hypothetical protein
LVAEWCDDFSVRAILEPWTYRIRHTVLQPGTVWKSSRLSSARDVTAFATVLISEHPDGGLDAGYVEDVIVVGP